MISQSNRNHVIGLRRELFAASLLVAMLVSSCQTRHRHQGECVTKKHCVQAHGPERDGFEWACQQGECKIVFTDDQNPNDGGFEEDADADASHDEDTDTGDDSSCLNEILGTMEEGLCSCECYDCDCKRIDCDCDVSCYIDPPPVGCMLRNMDENGNLIFDDIQFENCAQECRTHGDGAVIMPCVLQNCVIPPNRINIDLRHASAEVCLADFNPILETVVITCDVDGLDTTVPQNDMVGWSLGITDGTNCLVFTGTWSEQELECVVEYREIR